MANMIQSFVRNAQRVAPRGWASLIKYIEVLSEVSKISFIKIDVERFEWEVLSGSQKILSKHRPVVVFELLTAYAKERGVCFEDFKVFFGKFQYVLKYLDHSNSKSALVSDTLSNMVVAIPEERKYLFDLT